MNKNVDVLVVGGGPAGLTAAFELRQLGVESVLVAERESLAGGIPRHSHHPGYGLRDLHRFMSGPKYAKHLTNRAQDSGVEVLTNTSVTDWVDQFTVNITSKAGRNSITAKSIILATGARERPRSARLIPGNRIRGIYTTGELQQAVYENELAIGSRAVILGAEHVSFSALMTLSHAGVSTRLMVTEFEKYQTFSAFKLGADLRFRVPLLTKSKVISIEGKQRVEAVVIRDAQGKETRIECDVVVTTGDWIADSELAQRGEVICDFGTTGPQVNQRLQTSVPHVFAAGNVLHPVTTADAASLDGVNAAQGVVAFLAGEHSKGLELCVDLAGPFAWISPQRIVPGAQLPPRGCFYMWPTKFVSRAKVEVWQGEIPIFKEVLNLIPNRPAELNASWISRVDPANGVIQIKLG
jgi:thioredoxin reductase